MLCQYYKSLRRQSSFHFIAYDQLEEADASMDVVEELVAERQARAFLTQLARLSLRDRRVIELLQSGVQGKDVAHQMGLSDSAVYQVRSRFVRAVRAEDLRLQDEDSEGGGP
jgi:FixJ family two-component response regulator